MQSGQAELDLLDKGRKAFGKGEIRTAERIFNEVIETNSKCSEAYYQLGNVFHTKGEIGKAVKAFSKVLELDESHTDASISLAVLYNDIGKYEQARKIFETANERVKNKGSDNLVGDDHINKKFSYKHYELAEMYVLYNRYDEALFEYNKATKLDPQNHELKIKLAKVYAKKGFIGKAFDELKKLINEVPNYYPARLSLGILYYGMGKVIEAQTEWEKILSKEPGNAEALMYLNLSRTASETLIN